MIVVKIELWSAITGKVTPLGAMVICNDGTTKDPRRGSYNAHILRKGCADFRDPKQVTRTARVENYPRQSYVVWELLRRVLNVAYGKKGEQAEPLEEVIR